MGQSKKARAGFKNRLGTTAPVVVRPTLTTKQCYHNKDTDNQCKKKSPLHLVSYDDYNIQ